MSDRPEPTVTVKLPGSLCNWLVTGAGRPANAESDAAYIALLDARRIKRRFGYYLVVEATAPVLAVLTERTERCRDGHPGKSNERQNALSALGRLAYAQGKLDAGPAPTD
ncbi:hypothetical protein [Streptomyces sp. NPDC056670]|uniref:hypothetical protein n=1 Tax=Streptomyces sp. NPDC056670 TaxID=3345904 RepID=UPI0036BDBEC0